MVEPRWVSWSPDASVAVLAYEDTLVFCRTQPSFSAFASLPLKVCPACARARAILCWVLRNVSQRRVF